MKEIQLTQGKVAQVSDHRFEYLNQWKWCASYWDGKWYAMRRVRPFPTPIYMHRLILNAPKGMQVDHRDNDGLNNQDENIRLCTQAENLRNKGKQKNNTSGFNGVYWDKAFQRYFSSIGIRGKNIHLGHFDDPVEAAHAYDKAAKKYHGEFARLNFPD